MSVRGSAIAETGRHSGCGRCLKLGAEIGEVKPNKMNVLYSTHTAPDYMPPLVISDRQIIVGPRYPCRIEGKTVRTLHVPPGRYDLGALVASVPAEQRPDLTLALADAFEICLPERLINVPGRKLLLVADTHQGSSPLQKMLAYARREPFDRIIVTHDPHHLHWFTEAAIAPTTYVPNINCAYFPLRVIEQRRPGIVFVGQVGKQHLRRQYLLNEIQKAGLPLIVHRAPAPFAATLYNSTQITFNCSLNGDLNMRIFEVMAANGFLITDRLSSQSGLQTLFDNGKEYIEYEDLPQLLELLRYHLAHPDECLKIAKAGHRAYVNRHSPEQRIKDILDFVFGNSPIPSCSDPRARPGTHHFGNDLDDRVRLYELFQELSRQNERIVVLVDPVVGPRAISDLVDLARLQIVIDKSAETTGGFKEAMANLGVLNQVRFVDASTEECDIQLFHSLTLRSLRDTQSLRSPLVAVMTDASAPDGHAIWLTSHGFQRIGEGGSLFRRAK